MKTMKLLALGLLLCVSAHAATIEITAGTGTKFLTKQDGSGNNASSITICDATAPGICGPVSATLGLGVNVLDGSDVTLGAKADSVCGTATGTCTLQALVKFLNNAVSSAIPAGANLIGAVSAQPTPVTSGGLTTFFLQPTASDNHANIKNGAGQVYRIKVTNNSATINYLRLYNAGTGFNGCNSATNLVDQWAIPASTSGAGFVENIDMGLAFATGISICVTSGYATTDTTNATASAMSVGIGYK